MDVQRYDMRVDISNYGLKVELEPEESDSGEWVRYDDHAAEVARLREALVKREWIDGHGCVTGDCPNTSQKECIDTLIAFVQELAKEARAALAARKDGA